MRLFVASTVFALLLAAAAEAGVVVVDGEKFEVRAKIGFATGASEIDASSDAILDEIAKALATYADIDQVVVEGHTDNVGDPEKNRQLSLARAEAVVAALRARGVSDKRVVAKGFGDTIPVADNDTPQGRERNRRVEFTILSRGGRATSVAGPLAKIASRFRSVEAKAPEQPAWQDGTVGTPLFRAWRVSTKEQSSADVAFKDTSRIHLRETTLVVIFGDSASPDGFAKKEQRRANLESGVLVSRLDELLGDAPLAVDTPSGVVDVGRGRAVVNAKPKVSVISNHKGDKVVVHGKTGKATPAEEPKVDVDADWGTRVELGKAPEPPHRLQAPPTIDRVTPSTAVESGHAVVRVRWTAPPTSTPTSATVEIRRATSIGQPNDDVVFVARVPAGVDSIEARDLAPGDYDVAVASIDTDGFESAAAELRVTVPVVVAAAPVVAPPPAVKPAPPLLPAGEASDDVLPIVAGVFVGVVGIAAVVVGIVAASQSPSAASAP